MKKIIVSFGFALLAIVAFGQVSKTVNVNTAGSLSNLLSDTEKQTVADLTVTGTIDARDVMLMRDSMTMLANLDLSGVNITAYAGIKGTINESFTYPANEMPIYSFSIPYSYSGKVSLKSVKLPISITSIGSYAFFLCNGLSGSFTIPDSVKSIGNGAFGACEGLTGNLTIPYSVTTIGDSAFYDCKGLTGSLIIPNTVTTIGFGAFYLCTGFSELFLPQSLSEISNVAFASCNGLKKITIANPIPPSIYIWTFYQVNKNTCQLIIPPGSEQAYQSASYWSDFFANIPQSKTIHLTTAGTLKDSLSHTEAATIASLFLTGIIDARDVRFMRDSMTVLASLDLSGVSIAAYTGIKGTINQSFTYQANEIPFFSFRQPSTYSGKVSLKSIKLPNSITSIGNYAFFLCSGLSGSFTIPDSVKSIGNGAFGACEGLTGNLTIPYSVTTIGDSA
ncbi:MAG: leucine-rich repeat domain-containing protein, partial [Bacteroidota bacterium]|nr:leucine-rich repeat domain-containing protein [Bacteroidota bacterium]